MTTTLKSVIDLVDERPDVNNQENFQILWKIFSQLRKKIDAKFDLKADPSAEKFQPYYSLDGSIEGNLKAFTSEEIDWMIHAWTGSPTSSFSNMHLTIWLGPQTKVPHLWLALGTIPDLFIYFDYGPRVDMSVETEYLDKYYEKANRRFMEFQHDERFSQFISQSVSVRQFLSPTAICLSAPPSEDRFELLEVVVNEMVDQWLEWVEQGDPVPVEEQPQMAARDHKLRKEIAERDPVNSLIGRLFGEEMEKDLVRALWKADAQN